MVLRNLFALKNYLEGRADDKKKGQDQKAVAEQEADRPRYSEEDLRKIRSIWRKRLEGKNPDFLVVSRHIKDFFNTASPEQIRTFAYYALMHGFNFASEKAETSAKVVAANKDFFHGGFEFSSILDLIQEDAEAEAKKNPLIENSDDYTFVRMVLKQPKKYKKIFEVFYRRPPGGTPLFTQEEWERK